MSKQAPSPEEINVRVVEKEFSMEALKLGEVGINHGTMPYNSEYLNLGVMVDMWADLVEGYGKKAEDFVKAFVAHLQGRKIADAHRYIGQLTATGLSAPFRNVFALRRGVAKLTVYTATQGDDLYISWRAYIQGEPDLIKLLLVGLVAAVIGIPFGIEARVFGETTFNTGSWFTAAFILGIVFVVVMAVYGFFFRDGDFLSLFRNSIHELHVDDVTSLTAAVHLSVLAAAEEIGIDRAILEPREPYYRARSKKRRI